MSPELLNFLLSLLASLEPVVATELADLLKAGLGSPPRVSKT